MRDVYIVGAHMIKFDKYLDKSIKELSAMTVTGVLKDAGMSKKDIQALWFSNSGWEHSKGQSSIRAQVALRPMGIDAIPMTNVENACAGGSTAFHQAWLGVASGLYETTMAVGAEKLYSTNKPMIFAGFLGGIDIENCVEIAEGLSVFSLTPEEKKQMETFKQTYHSTNGAKSPKKKKPLKIKAKELKDNLTVAIMLGEKLGYDTVKKMRKLSAGDHSPFMDVYGYAARQHMKKYGSTIEQLAMIASKSHFNSTLNPHAQYRFEVPVEKVLSDRIVSFPVTRAMCAPVGDGSASAILCSEERVKQLGLMGQAVRVRASILGSGKAHPPGSDEPEIGERLARQAYEVSGLGPEDVDFAEVHDATAFGELVQAENLGFCPKGEGGLLAERGETRLGGKIPINTSGGLVSRGHPIGASGLAQIFELTTQLRGNAGKRQVEGAMIGMAENGGGALGSEEAAMCMHILEAPAKQ
ncbi:MAG: thiolase family protein [Thermodesulfobacteriota bacterium]|nr:thiolase family protein [Thermodesulfobacteriota bacterium]